MKGFGERRGRATTASYIWREMICREKLFAPIAAVSTLNWKGLYSHLCLTDTDAELQRIRLLLGLCPTTDKQKIQDYNSSLLVSRTQDPLVEKDSCVNLDQSGFILRVGNMS